MPRKVIVGAVGDTPELAPAEGEQELKVGRGLGVERKLGRVMVAQAQVLFLQPDGQQELFAE